MREKKTVKPPLGVMPKIFWEEVRMQDLRRAIYEYINEGLCVDPKWVDEYNSIVGSRPMDERVKMPTAPEPRQQLKMGLGVYRHFKGTHYDVLDVAKHSENGEELVVYKSKYGVNKTTWARPISMFNDIVEVGELSVPRFEYIMDEKR